MCRCVPLICCTCVIMCPQELLRKLFEALEAEFEGTEQAKMMDKLFGGEFSDYVKCQECGFESSRKASCTCMM